MPEPPDSTTEEFALFAQRFMHFMNLYTVYRDFLRGHYVPTVKALHGGAPYPEMQATLMLMLYAYFYSLVDHDRDSINAFRIWRKRFPEEENAIAIVEAEVEPFRDDLKRFRNRIGFHGSRTMSHESSGFNVFANNSGAQILAAIDNFKALGARFFRKDVDRQRVLRTGGCLT